MPSMFLKHKMVTISSRSQSRQPTTVRVTGESVIINDLCRWQTVDKGPDSGWRLTARAVIVSGALFFSLLPTADSRAATLSRSPEKKERLIVD